tara:strand:+ start:269 stop:409 length:141 start_codon:yes stop_codon:yes gene_type:complete
VVAVVVMDLVQLRQEMVKMVVLGVVEQEVVLLRLVDLLEDQVILPQ